MDNELLCLYDDKLSRTDKWTYRYNLHHSKTGQIHFYFMRVNNSDYSQQYYDGEKKVWVDYSGMDFMFPALITTS